MLNSITISDAFNFFDYFVFISITLSTILFVLWGNKKAPKKESESFMDLMLMGRSLTLPMFIATLVATWYGGIFGVAQIAFEYGIFNFITQGVFWYLTYLIFAFFIVDKIKNYKAVTLPDLAGQMFGPKSQILAGIFNLLNLVPIVYTISIGLLIQMVTGLNFYLSITIGISFVLSYSFLGGFRAVVLSDIFQFFVMLISIILVCAFSLGSFGFEILDTLPKRYFEPLGGFTFPQTIVWGLIALGTLVDPNFYQRCFAAKDFKIAKKGIIISTIIWMIFDICLTLGAIYAKALIPNADPSQGYFIYAIQLLPHGLRGFFLAGIFATILSTLDSYISLAGSTIAYDLVPRSIRGQVRVHHISVLSVSIFAILLAFIFDGNIKSVWKTLGSISSASLLAPIIFGYSFKGKLSDNGFVLSALLGAFGTAFWRLSDYKNSTEIDEIYIGILFSLLGILLSLLSGKYGNKKISDS